MDLTIAHLCPELLNLYGDKGNIIAISRRCEWRGIGVRVKNYSLDEPIDFSSIDIVILGGGSDREQLIVSRKLQTIKQSFTNYVENGGSVLAVCGGYQLLGEYYQLNHEKISGLDILDIYTIQKEGRLISNAILETEYGTVVGFENHGGRTYIKTYGNGTKPFGKVLFGSGNNAEDGFEGATYKNVIGTYLHGPLLPKNPKLTDLIIKRALERKYKKKIQLAALNDKEENIAQNAIIDRFLTNKHSKNKV